MTSSGVALFVTLEMAREDSQRTERKKIECPFYLMKNPSGSNSLNKVNSSLASG